MKGPVTQEWVHSLTRMQQTVLLTAIRGPDGYPKYGPVKMLLRWYRRCFLVSSLDGCNLENPFDFRGGSFMGPSIDAEHDQHHLDWRPYMDNLVDQYLREVDRLPHHFQLHFMHAVQILGYKHPNIEIRDWWHKVYARLVNDMHLHPETCEEMDMRLGDDREAWLARSDKATSK